MIPLPLIVGLDVVGTAALLAAVGILLWRRGRPLRGLGPFVLLSLLLLGLLEETANVMEASGYLREADLFEGSLAALFPTVWLGLFAMELERDNRERLSQTHERFRAVHDLALKLTMTLEPRAVMDEVADAASRLLGAPFVVILTPDAARETLAAQAGRGISPDERRAWRFAMHEGGTLRITTENLVVVGRDAPAPAFKAGRCVAVTVADTGQGIPPDIQSRVFEPFFTTKADIGGTGLGLSTAYAIIMRHGGTVTLRSQPGQDTAFRIVLPAVEQPAAVPSTSS